MPETLAAVSVREIAMLCVLLLSSFFFAGTETALTTLGLGRSLALREKLGTTGRVLKLWIDRPRQVLSALLLGNTLAAIAATAVTTEIALTVLGSAGLAVVTAVMTFVVLVFGEILPKTLARENAERVAVPCLLILRPFFWAVFPIVWVLDRFVLRVAKAVGSKGKVPAVTSEEIDFMIGLGSEVGALSGVKRELLNSVLEFTDLLVKEIMVPRTQVVAFDVDAEPEELFALLEANDRSRIPVYSESIDQVVGILVVKDLLDLGHDQDAQNLVLRQRLREPFFVPEVMKVSRLMKEMQNRHLHMAIVVDEFGGTSGVVTLEDVVEEIVGEIEDETDVKGADIRRLPDGRLEVSGSLHLRDLEPILGTELPDEGDFESIGGLLTATAGRVPSVGTLLNYRGFTFVVLEADERRVLRVEVGTPTREKTP